MPSPSPADLPDSGIEPRSPTLQGDSLPSEPPGNQHLVLFTYLFFGCAACQILVPQPLIEPTSPALEVWGLNHWTIKEVPRSSEF